MGEETGRSAEMRRMLEEYGTSGLTRRQYCEQRGIALTTFDYWHRELRGKPRMVKVEVAAGEAAGNFVLSLAKWAADREFVGVRRRGAGAADTGGGKRVMFSPGVATKIFLAVEAIDMRKGFEGLYGLVRDHLEQDPLSGHWFLFTNRTRTRLKALVWDGSGLWVCAKRLEKGR